VANGRKALLLVEKKVSAALIFQAIDASGRDSSIRHVLSGVNPEGCDVFGFKQPSAEERELDFSLAHDLPIVPTMRRFEF
jgi:polyphosphate kinase 2 (PPK2 family)